MPATNDTSPLATLWFQATEDGEFFVQFPSPLAAQTARAKLYRYRSTWKRQSPDGTTPYDKYQIIRKGQNLHFKLKPTGHETFTIIIPQGDNND